MTECLSKICGENTGSVSVSGSSLYAKLLGVVATTDKNAIFLNSKYVTCDGFWKDTSLVLHEYYRVLKQWNTGDMIVGSYLLESLGKDDKWAENKYEIAANAFASTHKKELEDCLSSCKK